MANTARTVETEALAGLVERVTFHNPDNGFCVLRIKARGQRELITVVGHAATVTTERTPGRHRPDQVRSAASQPAGSAAKASHRAAGDGNYGFDASSTTCRSQTMPPSSVSQPISRSA